MSAVQLLTLFAECSCSTSYSPHFFLRLCFHSLFSRRVPVCKPWRVHRYTIQYNPVIDTCDVWLHPFSTSLARTVRGCLLLVPNAKSAACIHTTGVVGTHCLLVNARTASIFATSLCCRHWLMDHRRVPSNMRLPPRGPGCCCCCGRDSLHFTPSVNRCSGADKGSGLRPRWRRFFLYIIMVETAKMSYVS